MAQGAKDDKKSLERAGILDYRDCWNGARHRLFNRSHMICLAIYDPACRRYGKYIAEKVYEDENDDSSNPLSGLGSLTPFNVISFPVDKHPTTGELEENVP